MVAALDPREVYLKCVDGLLTIDPRDSLTAIDTRDGARVSVTLETTDTPVIIERYSVQAPWVDPATDLGVISTRTPMTSNSVRDLDVVDELVSNVRHRIAAMRSAELITGTASRVLEGVDSRFEPLDLPKDFSDWAIIGVWARARALGGLTLDDMISILDEFTWALQGRFLKNEDGLWDTGDAVPRGVEIATVTASCFAALLYLGMEPGRSTIDAEPGRR